MTTRPRRRRRGVRRPPLVLRLDAFTPMHDRGLLQTFVQHFGSTRHQARMLLGMFRLTPHERDFVNRLLKAVPDIEVFRCNQRHYCGDFALVTPRPAMCVLIVELKQRERLKIDQGVGYQLRYAHLANQALQNISSRELGECPHHCLLGSPDRVLAFLCDELNTRA